VRGEARQFGRATVVGVALGIDRKVAMRHGGTAKSETSASGDATRSKQI